MGMDESKPVIAVTMGDPAGIGPQIAVKSLGGSKAPGGVRPVIVGDLGVLEETARRLGADVRFEAVGDAGLADAPEDAVAVFPVSRLAEAARKPGRPTEAGAAAAYRYLEVGAQWAIDGRAGALVTGPISKAWMRRAGFEFPGHTEFLAHRAGDPPVVMMLAGPKLKVALVTVHLAHARVPERLTANRVLTTARITHQALIERFGLRRPNLAVAGLNPHAGESGLFGREEIDILEPAVRAGLEEGLNLSGPHPPDSLFYFAAQGHHDAVVCMYHDQGLIPFKLLHFRDGVNVTLGLPFIRTSVDHGTAFELAESGRADPASLTAALEMAADMARRRNS